MPAPQYDIYCDKADDEELARLVFTNGPLSKASVRRLPVRPADAPPGLVEFLQWERSDWLILRDGVLVAAAELSRHGYTGDNGFQRFARLHRAASLGVPGVYFTPFSRTRLSEIDKQVYNPRNVSPEMFAALILAGNEFGVPCLALRWPTDEDGEPIPLREPAAASTINDLRELMEGFAERGMKDGADWSWIPDRIRDAMVAQAAIPYRGSETRFSVQLPIPDIQDSAWLQTLLPADYFSRGKADKILAKLALDGAQRRMLTANPAEPFWDKAGRAQVLFLGYQWRPDPASGLIAFSGTLARAKNRPLIVVWPRVYLHNGDERRSALAALAQFAVDGTGPIQDIGRTLDISDTRLLSFQARVNTSEQQFGLFTVQSKVGRILADNADLCVFGDSLHVPR